MSGILTETLPMLATLIVVILIILYLSYLFSKFVARSSLKMNSRAQSIKILDRAAVGTDRSIDIIQVNKRYFLIGNTPSGMVCLAELSQEDIVLEKKENDMENGGGLFQKVLFDKWKIKK